MGRWDWDKFWEMCTRTETKEFLFYYVLNSSALSMILESFPDLCDEYNESNTIFGRRVFIDNEIESKFGIFLFPGRSS